MLLLAFVRTCSAGQQTIEFFHPVTPENVHEDARRQSYEELRVLHDAPGFFAAGHPKEYQFDLDGDRRPEVFLLYSGHSYWGGYSVFTRRHSKWTFIGRVSYGGQPPIRRSKRRDGWHDFSIDTGGSRNRLDRTCYRWDTASKVYVEHSRREVRPMFSREP